MQHLPLSIPEKKAYLQARFSTYCNIVGHCKVEDLSQAQIDIVCENIEKDLTVLSDEIKWLGMCVELLNKHKITCFYSRNWFRCKYQGNVKGCKDIDREKANTVIQQFCDFFFDEKGLDLNKYPTDEFLFDKLTCSTETDDKLKVQDKLHLIVPQHENISDFNALWNEFIKVEM
jgi:hypothetical protein